MLDREGLDPWSDGKVVWAILSFLFGERDGGFDRMPDALVSSEPRYPIAAQIFCAFSPVNVMSSCAEELRSK